MIKLEFEHLIERPISDEEFRKIQLVYMNTEAIETPLQMSYIYLVWGEKGIDILYSLVMERGRLIEEVGELKRELSNVKKENRLLREFRGVILKAYEEAKKDV
ncbi:hypothetical protein NSB25_11155 [Acetatifactor muris]|uniref:Uncharacterized protein n=1 Tax=Acetatifactor muris TaxID=879566 RepID=A0A2K4ZGQ7_9FIRM|nr:hypothetical protein [Acetatifactor muris]MCR2047841.1 hypothetical protein [Acetatifactor muris]SOY29645.1 hypothetical protein AMURIS_02366 [Acetatifactor muris]